MPLHDWATLSGWEGVHQVWIVELLYWIKPRLPTGYRAYIGSTPTFAIGAPTEDRPDLGVRNGTPENKPAPEPSPTADEPDEEIAVAMLAGESALMIEQQGRLVAAVELVSPRNKDRTSARAAYSSVYAGYLLRGVNLLLVYVHRRPLRFSFADQIADDLGFSQPPCPAPLGISYRVGEPAPGGGRFLALWRRPLTIGAALPSLRLPLSVEDHVLVDLEQTYVRATEAAYLS